VKTLKQDDEEKIRKKGRKTKENFKARQRTSLSNDNDMYLIMPRHKI